MTSTVIVVPCFNEAGRINRRAYVEFVHQHADIRLVLVDDGSQDETPKVLAGLAAQAGKQMLVLRNRVNSGKAESVRRGVLAALDQAADFVGYWDADLATPLSDIVGFRRVLVEQPEIELVIGSRIPLLGHHIRRTLRRRLLGRLFARTAARVLALDITDTQCGAKLFRAHDLVRDIFSEPFLTRWIFDVEILARWGQTAGRSEVAQRIYEFPLDRWEDVAGSRLKTRDFAVAATELARIYWRYCRRGSTPLARSGAGGVPSMKRRAA